MYDVYRYKFFHTNLNLILWLSLQFISIFISFDIVLDYVLLGLWRSILISSTQYVTINNLSVQLKLTTFLWHFTFLSLLGNLCKFNYV